MEENHFQLTTAQQHLIHSYRYGNVASIAPRFLPVFLVVTEKLVRSLGQDSLDSRLF